MDVTNLCRNINEMLVRMDQQFMLAKKTMGVRIDMELAKQRILDAEDTIHELATLINDARAQGIVQPPDVTLRLNMNYTDVEKMATEILEFEAFIAQRNVAQQPLSNLN
jgi:hypothetical protein